MGDGTDVCIGSFQKKENKTKLNNQTYENFKKK